MVYMVKKSKKVSIVSYIIGNSLKFEADAKTKILNVHTASEKFAELILVLESNGNVETFREKLNDEYLEIPTDMVNRVLAGLVLYEIKELWRVALLISTLSYPQVGSFSQAELQRRKEKYVRVELLITDLGLDGVWNKLEKPLLDGSDIQRVLQIPKGRLVGNWLHRELKWQLAHPRGTKEECEQWMKQSLLPKRQKVEK